MKHATLDFESLSLANNAVLIQVGFAGFNPYSVGDAVAELLHATITTEDQLSFGHIDEGTMKWWLKTDSNLLGRLLSGVGPKLTARALTQK